ncbi:MAG: DUF1003 domain-containing protein [Nanoarchaeota archaeon]
MAQTKEQSYTCQICGQQKKSEDVVSGDIIRKSITDIIKKKHPEWTSGSYICSEDLNKIRNDHVENLFRVERGELTKIQKEVIESLKEHDLLSENINIEFSKKLTFGEKLSDKIAEFGGSWRFIIIFWLILLIWVSINSIVLLQKPFDPYPFILLNLVLSCLAAIQAPIIMMSQNRQEAKDRLRSEYDYKINMKAELEIRHLNEKIDMLMKHQWKRLLEIQQIQIDQIQEWKKGK